MFDGVHRGHQAVISAAIHAARASGGQAGVLTFDPHPSRLFRPENATRLLQTLPEKLRRLAKLGVDFCVTHPFTPDFAALDAAAFLEALHRALPSLVTLYAGSNFRYGRGRQGTVETLRADAAARGLTVVGADRLTWAAEPISSTRIRAALESGDLALANALLGYPYHCVSTLQPGQQLGRSLGFPTLNLPWQPELCPRFGVYAVRFRPLPDDASPALPTTSQVAHPSPIADPDHARAVAAHQAPPMAPPAAPWTPGVANYGLRPTVNADLTTTPLLEIHALAAPPPLTHGDRIEVEWLHFLRPEHRFPNLEALQAQIAEDVSQACNLLEVTGETALPS